MSRSNDMTDILGVFSAYSWAVDRGRADLLSDVFHKSAVLQLADGVVYTGLDEIIAAQPDRQLRRPQDSLHTFSNSLFDFDGDRAQIQSNWLWYGEEPPSPWRLLSFGDYDDVVVRTSGRWKITRRVITRRVSLG